MLMAMRQDADDMRTAAVEALERYSNWDLQ